MKETIQQWLAKGIRTPQTAAYRGISLEEFLLDIEAGGFMGSMKRHPQQSSKTCVPVYLSPLNLRTLVPSIQSPRNQRFYQDILMDPTISKIFGNNEEEIVHAQNAAQDHAVAVYLNYHGFSNVDVVMNYVDTIVLSSTELPKGYHELAAQFNITQDEAEAVWKEAIQRKGLVIAFNETLLEKRVIDCCYPDCLNVMLPTGQTLPFSCVDGIEISTAIEKDELFAVLP